MNQPNETNYCSTPILDYENPAVSQIVSMLRKEGHSKHTVVLSAHGYLMYKMNAVYSIDETQPASETLRLNQGSCGQRMSCLEALARGYGVATRVRALWLDRSFWYSRLPLLRFFLPKRTLMPWPQFYIDDKWVDFDELYTTIEDLAATTTVRHAFTNKGESLFDAIRHFPVDFLGKLRSTSHSSFDISRFVLSDGGFFDSRDELLAKLEPKRSWFGAFLFNAIYGGRKIRRIPE